MQRVHGWQLWRAGAMLAVALVMMGGCGKGPGGGAKRIPRDQDAAAVVLVDSPDERVVSFTSEIEPNNQTSQATSLAPGQGVRGSLDGETDVDVYRVEVTGPGFLAARLGGVDQTLRKEGTPERGVDQTLRKEGTPERPDVDLVLTVRDGAGKVLARSDRGPALTIEGVPNLPVASGTYYLEVAEFVKKKARPRGTKGQKGQKKPKGAGEAGEAADPPADRIGASPLYELTTSLAARPAEHFEAEPNATGDSAAEVLPGDPGQGYFGWADDVDVWKLSVEGFAPEYGLDIELTEVPGVTPTMTVRDDRGGVLLAYSGAKDRGLSVRNLVMAASDAGAAGGEASPPGDDRPARFYTVELAAKRSNPVDAYRLEVSAHLLDVDEESEPNDQEGAAMPVGDDARAREGTRRGYLTLGDVDYYRLPSPDEPVFASVTVKPAGPSDIELSLLVDGKVQAMANQGKASVAESLADVRVEPGAIVLVKVAGRGALGRDAAYELRFAFDPAGPARLGPGEESSATDDGQDE